jgi:hypothetical protein
MIRRRPDSRKIPVPSSCWIKKMIVLVRWFMACLVCFSPTSSSFQYCTQTTLRREASRCSTLLIKYQHSFPVNNQSTSPPSATLISTKLISLSPTNPTKTHDARLFQSKYDGSGRGKILLTIVLMGCVWLFSIPPYFRRAHLCTTDSCVENRPSCYDCITFTEWRHGVMDYYRSGGGIHFDFSIDPTTKQQNARLLERIIGKP